MLPFAQERRRKINLGGATSITSQTDLLHSAKVRRTEREEIRRRHESARSIQLRWRSSQQSRAVKYTLSEMFQEDVLGLNGMRTLVLIGNNDSLLAQWSEAVVHAGNGEPSIHLNQSSLCVLSPVYYGRIDISLSHSPPLPTVQFHCFTTAPHALFD